MASERVLVVLMTYGSPETLEDVPEYLKKIRGGREPDPQLVSEFQRRYRLIGGSPLLRITKDQAGALEARLNTKSDGRRYSVAAGMRFSPPLIAEIVKERAPESGRVVGVIMSPQFSPIIMGGYINDLRRAVSDLGRDALELDVAENWHLEPRFLQALADRVTQALQKLPAEVREDVPVLLTAHSMPRRVVQNEPGYIKQLEETAAAVAELCDLSEGRWIFCYQSAGHTPEEWLKPDFADIMPQLRAAGHTHVLVAPVQFLADHLEVLYDIDIGAREQAELAGLKFSRIESLNTSAVFIEGLAAVVESAIGP
jgi:protoporphyrin/coproporphyrin ferrochelatase